jgi:integrase
VTKDQKVKIKLTDYSAKAAKAPATGRVEIFDELVTGLALRVTEKGAKSWTLLYRLDGKSTRETLGKYPALMLGAARDAAKEKLRLVAKGKDPRLEAARERAEQAKQDAETFGALAKTYRDEILNGQRSGAEMWSAIERDLNPFWRDIPVRDISRTMIISRLQAIAKPEGSDLAPRIYARNRRAALIRAMFNFALDNDLVDRNPAARLKMLEEKSRDRVLTDAEIVEVWQAAGKLAQPAGPLVRMLLLTGQRRSEISDLAWAEVDDAEKLLLIPAERMKAGLAHEIPLPPAALALLDEVPKFEPPRTYVFASPHRKDAAVNSFSQIKSDLDRLILDARKEKDPEAVAMPAWRFHDLRRTMRSGLARFGISPDIAERVLSHLPAGVQAVYDRHQYREQKRQAIATWCNHVAALLDPSAGKVADISAARKRRKGGNNG